MLQDTIYEQQLAHLSTYSKYPSDLSVERLIDLCLDPPENTDMFDINSRAYITTNEFWGDIYPNIDFEGKRVLSIISSAEFMIEALRRGASEVVGVDICFPACFMAELKFAGLRMLEYEEYLQFFSYNRNEKDSFSEDTYVRIRHLLSKTAKNFFDNIIGKTTETEDGILPMASKLITGMEYEIDPYNIPHLASKEIYEEAQSKITETPLMVPKGLGQAWDTPANGKFDIIYASNVPKEYSYLYSRVDHLNDKGQIIFFANGNWAKNILELSWWKDRDDSWIKKLRQGFEVNQFYSLDRKKAYPWTFRTTYVLELKT